MCFLYTLLFIRPLRGVLLTVERSARYHWLQSHDMFRRLDDSVANLTVHVASDRDDARTREHLKILKSVASCLGVPAEEMDRIVESVNEVGQDGQT